MSESTAVEAPAAKEPFFKMSSIPGANILVPLLLGCLLNTLFPDLFKTLGSFTLGMTQQGAGPLVGAFLLIVGTTISFKSAPAAAARGAIRKLGGEYKETRTLHLPGGDARTLILCKKISQTPTAYPRNGGKIAKSPLK